MVKTISREEWLTGIDKTIVACLLAIKCNNVLLARAFAEEMAFYARKAYPELAEE